MYKMYTGTPAQEHSTKYAALFLFKGTYLRNVVTKGKRGTFSVLPLQTIFLQVILDKKILQSSGNIAQVGKHKIVHRA